MIRSQRLDIALSCSRSLEVTSMLSLADIILVIGVYVYVFAVIAAATALQRKLKLHPRATRQMIHIFAGDAMLVLPLFSAWWYPFLLPLGLAIVVALGLTTRGSAFRRVMVDESGHSKLHALGPLYYVISIGALVPLTWGVKAVGVATVMVMAWGDGAAAALAPRIQGRHRYPFGDRSLEGSLIMLLFAFLGAALAWTLGSLTGAPPVPLVKGLGLALAGAAVGTVAEAFSVGALKPFDNFTVPLASALAMILLL